MPNLSSIVVLVEVGGQKLLLTGDAHGDDIVKAWEELGLATPAKVDLLKMPHHGSIRNCTEKFLNSSKRTTTCSRPTASTTIPMRRRSRRW